MFAQIKDVVDLIRSGLSDFRKFKTEKECQDAVLDILKVYFLLKDCVDEGEKLVTEAEPNPVEKITAMEPSLALSTIERWDRTIWKQSIRLYRLQSAIFGQCHLSVINPDLQDRISEVIGYKMDRTVTLHGIGPALFFKNMFPIANTIEEKAHYISVMAGEKKDALNMSRIKAEIACLRESLDQYRLVVERMVSNAELMQLSKRARKETHLPDEA